MVLMAEQLGYVAFWRRRPVHSLDVGEISLYVRL